MSLPNLTTGEDIAVVNTSAFERLYWPILDKEGISNIRVADKENNTSSSSRASFTNHPVALEPATVTNASKIFVTAECLACKEGEWNDGFEGQPEGVERLEDAWDYFVIETADGSPVLVRDVVAQVHAWAANPFIGDKIREGMVWMYNASFQRGEDGWCSIGVGCEDDVDEVPEGTKIFFEHFFEHGPDQDTGVPVVSIEFWVEGWMGNSAEYFWKSRGDPELQYGLHHWHDPQGMVCAYPNGDRCLASFQMETIIACVESVLTYLVGPPSQRPVTQYTMPPNNVYGVPTPSEASTAPDDTETWYCGFWEKACAVPHKDGNNIIIYEPKETGIPDPRARPEWASKRLRKAYELLGEGHPRIVRCIGLLDNDAGNGVTVERLDPGPHWGDLPVMTTPVQETPSREDKIMLALYYRWALQALNVWLRSDFSLAITGFISVEGPELDADALRDAWKQSKRDERQERDYQAFVAGRTQEPEPSDEESNEDSEEIPKGFSESWSEGEWAGDGNALFYDDYFNITYPREGGYHRKPLFYWASFVWELMTNGLTAEAPWKRDIDWSPFSSPEGRPTEEAADWRDQLQVLEQARLGSVLLKAWKGEYESAEQAAEDIRKIAEEVGINVVNSMVEVGDDWMKLFKDEVDIGEPWKNIFELDEAQKKWGTRTLRFKRKSTHVNLPTIEESGLAGP